MIGNYEIDILMYNQRGKGKELFISSYMLNIFTDLVDYWWWDWY